MYPKYSDVFSEYAKIALEQGLISNAEDNDSSKPVKEEKKELSNAEVMYGTKHKPIKELLEEAHPKTVVMGPSYDRFNGVVENLQQRQNMMVDIALKNPRILQTNTRYVKAQKELIDETIKLGFYLDSLHQESLMRLADACTGNLTKIAVAPAAGIGAVGVVAAIAGIATLGLAASAHFPQSQGIVADLQRLSEELQEAIQDYPNLSQYVEGDYSYINNIEDAAKEIENLNDYLDGVESRFVKGSAIRDKFKKEQYFANLAQRIISQGIDKEIERRSNSIIQLLDTIQTQGRDIKRIMKSAPKKYQEKTNETLSTLQKLYHTVVPSDVADVANIIEMLVESSQEYKNDLRAQLNNLRTMKSALNSSLQSEDRPFAGPDDIESSEIDAEPAAAPVAPRRPARPTQPAEMPESIDPDQELAEMLEKVED